MTIINKIKMDLSKSGVPHQIDAVQGDANSRVVEISLYDSGTPFMVPINAIAFIRYGNPDGTGGTYDTLPDGTKAWFIGDNSVTVTLAPQMLSVPGYVSVQVELVSDIERIATFTFKVLVESDPSVGTVTSEDYYNLSQWAEKAMDERLEEAQKSGFFDGVSPTVEVSDFEGGHRVSITDANGEKNFDVLDGVQGEQGIPGMPGTNGINGVSPVVTVTNITGGHRVAITDANGTKRFDVMDGADASVENALTLKIAQGSTTANYTYDGSEPVNVSISVPATDNALSETSTNPVSNAAVAEALAEKAPATLICGHYNVRTNTAIDNACKAMISQYAARCVRHFSMDVTSTTLAIPSAYYNVEFVNLTASAGVILFRSDTHTLRRTFSESTLGKFEWENPPMSAGTEYRTTARWQGKAVYTKLVDCGTLPNSTAAYINDIFDSVPTNIISIDGIMSNSNGSDILPMSACVNVTDIWVNRNSKYFGIKTNSDMSAYTGNVIIKYTKD